MPNLREAMKIAKATGKTVRVTEPMNEPSEIKVNISIRVDYEVLEWLKKRGDKLGMPYQSFLNLILNVAKQQDVDPRRMFISDSAVDLTKRIEKLEKLILEKERK